jgi:hypothetical protein
LPDRPLTLRYHKFLKELGAGEPNNPGRALVVQIGFASYPEPISSLPVGPFVKGGLAADGYWDFPEIDTRLTR